MTAPTSELPVAVLPISVQGLGVMQAMLVVFFARYAPGAAEAQRATVVTASLTVQAIATIFQAVLGLACLRSQLGREVRAAAESAVSPAPAAD